jgi:hypothetical protein
MEYSKVRMLSQQLAHVSDALRAVATNPNCTLAINVSPVETFVIMCNDKLRKVLVKNLQEELSETFEKLDEETSKQF